MTAIKIVLVLAERIWMGWPCSDKGCPLEEFVWLYNSTPDSLNGPTLSNSYKASC